MKITDYSFGRITVDGQTYTSDVIIHGDDINDKWWRDTGHRLAVTDLADVVQDRPEVLIVGTGHSGQMEVPEQVRHDIQSYGIELHVLRTGDAVRIYNELSQERGPENVAAALHLTC